MKKEDFLKIAQQYQRERKRLRSIKPGDLVWETCARGGSEMDYHLAVVMGVNVDECYVDVIDVTRDNKEFRYNSFKTEEEMIAEGFTKEVLTNERKKYVGIINRVLNATKR